MIMPARYVKIGGGTEACAARGVDEPHFAVSFNHK